jgi:thioredoxin-like negative regulator of GroEL
VGLHVWPTTSLKDVGDVLSRDDLAELIPLKYYLVRSDVVGDPNSAGVVVSGRISVNLESQRPGRQQSAAPFPTSPSTGSLDPPMANRPELAYAPAPSTGPRGQIKQGDGGQIVTEGSGLVFFYDKDNAQSRRLRDIVAALEKDFKDRLALFTVDTTRFPEIARAFDVDVFNLPALVLFKDGKTVYGGSGEFTKDDLRSRIQSVFPKSDPAASALHYSPSQPLPLLALPGETTPPKIPQTDAEFEQMQQDRREKLAQRDAAAVARRDKSTLRYDGRSFDEWHGQWLSDGLPSRKLEALKALEAFAAAGYRDAALEAILHGAFSDTMQIAQHSRKYLSTLSPTEAQAAVRRLLDTLKTELGPKRRVAVLRAIAAIGPPAEPALEDLKKALASDDLQERIAAAAAIKMVVGKDQYQKPLADVLGEELGITVVQTESGVWGALPREDAGDKADVYGRFNDAVIREQQLLFPLFPPDKK